MTCDHGSLKGDATVPNAWEVFQVIDLGSNRVALKSVEFKTYIVAKPDGSISCESNAIGSWETFTIAL